MPIYSDAPDVESLAEDLIHLHHPHLIDEPIRYIFRDKAAKKHDKIVRGTASILGGRTAFFSLTEEEWDREEERQESPSFFVIEIAADQWAEMSSQEQQALVDHELSHCWACDVEKGKGEGKRPVRSLSLRGHDVEEFAHIVQRYGMWHAELSTFNKVCREKSIQLGLFETDGVREQLGNAAEIPVEDEASEEQPVAVTTGGKKAKAK